MLLVCRQWKRSLYKYYHGHFRVQSIIINKSTGSLCKQHTEIFDLPTKKSKHHLETHVVIKCLRKVSKKTLWHEGPTSTSRTLKEQKGNKWVTVTKQKNINLRKAVEYLTTYLANGTYTFAFPAQAFPGLWTLQSMLAVGTLPTIDCVAASNTLSTRDPLQVTGGQNTAGVHWYISVKNISIHFCNFRCSFMHLCKLYQLSTGEEFQVCKKKLHKNMKLKNPDYLFSKIKNPWKAKNRAYPNNQVQTGAHRDYK